MSPGNHSQLQPAHITAMAWVRAASTPSTVKYVLSHGVAGSCSHASYGLYTGGSADSSALRFYIWNGTSSVVSPAASNTMWNGQWHMVAGTYDGSTVRLYVDGTQVGSGTAGSGNIAYGLATNNDFIIGGATDTACVEQTNFTGDVDEVRVYGRALTGTEIGTLAAAVGPTPPELPPDDVPHNTARPQLSGTPKIGSQLSCTHGTWTNSPTSFAVTWERGLRAATADNDPSWHAIGGASGDNYTVQAADEGSRVRCHVTATNAAGSLDAVSTSKRTDAGVPVNTQPPQAAGSPIVGSTLTCNPGQWNGSPDLTYQWYRFGNPIPGATGTTYTLTRYRAASSPTVVDPNGDGDHLISCKVTGHNDLGDSVAAQGNYVLAIDGPPVDLVSPRIDGDGHIQSINGVQRPSPMGCSVGQWVNDYATFGVEPYVYRYQWYRNGGPIAGANTGRYVPTGQDYGRRLTCRVTNSNPAGTSIRQSQEVVVPLPRGTDDSLIFLEQGNNGVDPSNLMAVSGAYLNAIQGLVIDRLKKGIQDATDDCTKRAKAIGYIRSAPSPGSVKDPISEQTRCRVLVYAKDKVQPNPDGGVRYLNGGCTAAPEFATSATPLCPSLNIQVPSIDPTRPPAQDPELVERLKSVTPKAILWDLNSDGQTDAVCPGSAPVLRTILEKGQWNPRAVILDLDDLPAHFGSKRFNTGSAAAGTLRSRQVKVCATSFERPQNPSYPCVTDGEIGRIRISNANFCPIDARQIKNADFEQLLDGDAKQFLLRVSEDQLANEGAKTASARRPDGPAHTVYVPWEGKPTGSRGISVLPARGNDQYVRSSLGNGVSALTSVFQVSPSEKLIATAKADIASEILKSIPSYKKENGQFVFDQIYVSRGDPATINGVVMDAIGDTATLLLPSDIKEALPNVPKMSLIGRDVKSQLGPLAEGLGIPLTQGGQLKQALNDIASGNDPQKILETNLTSLLEDQKKQIEEAATNAAKQQARELYGKLADALDVEPFKFFGGTTVTAEKDGSATLHAHAELPNLSGSADGAQKISADVDIHADLQGHIELGTIHVHADNAYLGGINLQKVDVTFNTGTGLSLTGQIYFPSPIDFGIGINRFTMGPKGEFRELDVDYKSSSGTGIPLGNSGAFITTLGANFSLLKDEVGAHAIISAGSSVGRGCPSLGLDTGLQAHFAKPVWVKGTGKVLLTCVGLGELSFFADQTGYVDVHGDAHFNGGPLYFDGKVGGKFNLPRYQVSGEVEGGVRHVLSGHVEAVLSNLGLAGCGRLQIALPEFVKEIVDFFTGEDEIRVSGGASIDFSKGRPPFTVLEIINNLTLFTGCDIGRYYSLGKAAAAHSAQAGSAGFTLPAKAGPSLVSIEGAGAAPRVKLHSPSGKVIDLTDATGDTGKKIDKDTWGTVIDSEARTVVLLGHPETGRWTAEVAPGSSAVLRIRAAPILPPAGVKGRVTGRGTKRVLSYRILGRTGQSVQFVEEANRGRKVLKTTTKGGRGTVRYTVGEAFGTKRQVIAYVTQDGHPRKRIVVAGYKAKSPAVGKARVRVRRRGRNAVVTWSRASLADHYDVILVYGTGERRLVQPRGKSRRVVARGVRKGEGLIVTVQAFSRAGRSGRVARGRLAGSLRVGKVKRTPPYRHKPKKTKRLELVAAIATVPAAEARFERRG